MKRNTLEMRGSAMYYNNVEVGTVLRGQFRPTSRGERLGLFWAQVERRGALEYVSDVLRRSGKLSLTEWRLSRQHAARRKRS